MKRLKNIEGKNKKQLDAIKDQEEKQLEAIEKQKKNKIKTTGKDKIVHLEDEKDILFSMYPNYFNKQSKNCSKQLLKIVKNNCKK